MSRGPRSFSRVSSGDSDNPSSCEMKHEPAFKPLQGNPAFFRVRASLGPLHLRHQTPVPSLIPVDERRLLMRGLWKVCIPLESKPGNQLSSRDDLEYTELSWNSCPEFFVPLDLDGVLGESWELPKGSQATCRVWTGIQDGSGANSGESGLLWS